MSFLKRFFNKIKSFFNDYETQIKIANAAMLSVNALKHAVESKAVITLVKMTKIDTDDRILAVLQAILPRIAFQIAFTHGLISEKMTGVDAIKAIAEHVEKMLPEHRPVFWMEFTGKLAQALSDGKLSFAEAVVLGQLAFLEYKKTRQ